MKYTIDYYFDGNGSVEVEAKSRKEAEDMFFEGNFSNEKEWGENYQIEQISSTKRNMEHNQNHIA